MKLPKLKDWLIHSVAPKICNFTGPSVAYGKRKSSDVYRYVRHKTGDGKRDNSSATSKPEVDQWLGTNCNTTYFCPNW